MLNLDVKDSLPKDPSEFPESTDIYFGEVPFFKFSGYKDKDFRKAWCLFGIFSTEILNKKATNPRDMILKDTCRPDLITDKLIDHLKITKTFILALKWANRQSIDFTIVICFLSAVDTPAELAALDVEFVDYINGVEFKGFNVLRLRIGDDRVVLDFMLCLDWGLDWDLVEKHFAVMVTDWLDRDVVLVSDKLVVQALFVGFERVTHDL